MLNLSASKNFINAQEFLQSLARTLPTTVKMYPNPFNQWGGYPENSYQGYIYWIAKRTKQIINNESLTKSEIAGMKKQGVELPANPIWTWEIAAQAGYFKEGLFLRLLLSEFYCARCAIGASPFTNDNLKQVMTWPSVTSNSNGTLKSGGFDTATVQAFITKANGYTITLRIAREHFDPHVKPTFANPIKGFAGVIIVPSKKFIQQLGKIQIQNKVIDGPTFFGCKPPKTTSTKTFATTSISTTPLTTTLGILSQNVSPQETNAVKVSLEGQLQPPRMSLSTHSLCDLTLTSYKSNITLGNNQPLQWYLNSIRGSIGNSTFNIEIFNKLRAPNSDQTELIDFFLQTPSNPWALVIELDGELISSSEKNGGGTINISAAIPSIVQLNPGAFAQYTQLDSDEHTNFETLLAMPSDLYYGVQDTHPGKVTPTARLLRGICNGYLTSWKYHQLIKPNLSAWKPIFKGYTGINYPTPKISEFEKNNPNTMFYALYGTRKGLDCFYLTEGGIPAILDIIQNPNTSRPGYTVLGKKSNIITNIIAKMNSASHRDQQNRRRPGVTPQRSINLSNMSSTEAYKKGYRTGQSATKDSRKSNSNIETKHNQRNKNKDERSKNERTLS